MADIGAAYTDYKIDELTKKIEEVYSEARDDMNRKLQDFNDKYARMDAELRRQVQQGKVSQSDYENWQRGQVFQQRQWTAKRDQMIGSIMDANSAAKRLVRRSSVDVFTMNANYASYSIEHSAGVNFGFGIYNEQAVIKLLKDDPQILPEWKIDEQKDYQWNYKKVNNAVTQGIIQGERIDQITDRLTTNLCAQNENTMKTFARTAMTGAQNAGRQMQYENASRLGIKMFKEWIATLDSHTRDTHKSLDGQSVQVDTPFVIKGMEIMYPGDPHAKAELVYNCRCTMASDVVGYPDQFNRYDNIDGKPISNMSYRQWENAKKNGTPLTAVRMQPKKQAPKPEFTQAGIGAAKTISEINDLLNNNGLFSRGTANLNGCDLDSAKSIAAAYEQVFDKYPQLKGKFEAPNAQPVGMKDNTYAWCYIRSGGQVQVNPNRFNDWQKLSRSYDNTVISGYHPYGTTAESIVTHEIGHAIDGLLAKQGILGGVTRSGQFRYASSTMQNTIMKRAANINPQIALDMRMDKTWGGSSAIENNVSRYAAQDNQEWFAECFAEYITSANPRTVASEFGKELERLVSKIQ